MSILILLYAGLNSFVEPNFVIYSIDNLAVELALNGLKELLPITPADQQLMSRCAAQRKQRINLMNEALDQTVGCY